MKKIHKIFKNIILSAAFVLLIFAIIPQAAYTQQLDNQRLRLTPEQMGKLQKEAEKQQKINDFAAADATFNNKRPAVESQLIKENANPEKVNEILKETDKRNLALQQAIVDDSDECPGALKPDSNLDVTTPNSNNLFASQILIGMKTFMLNVYKTLAKLWMLGHALVCYATDIDYTCLGVGDYCAGKIPNLNFLISGAMIYVSGSLMAFAIGMYFVDISFKLGFAVLFMPISIALWPFPPTKNKLSENLSIIIRSGMLFMMVAIATSFCITLIKQGIFNPTTIAEDQFWNAIANKSTVQLSENFSIDTGQVLIILFCLLYGFKILSTNINKYLDYFFSDAAFGSESPMHMMGTQAFGMVTQNTIKPMASFAKDVALTQTGRAISGTVTGISKLGSAEGRKEWADGFRSIGRGIKRTTHAIANPFQTYNQAMQYSGKLANKGVQALGNVAKEAADIAIIPFTANQELRDKVAKSIDKAADSVGSGFEQGIAHGGGMAGRAAVKFAQNIADSEKRKDFISRASAAALNSMNAANPETASAGLDAITPEQVRGKLHNLNTALQDKKQAALDQTVDFIAEKSGKSKEEVLQNFADFGRKVDNLTAQGQKAGRNIVKGGVALALATKTGVLGLLSIPDKGVDLGAQLFKSQAAKGVVSTLARANAAANSAPITLQPSALISAPFKAIGALKNWEDTLKNIAQAKAEFDELRAQGAKAIIKQGAKTGAKIVLRTTKGTIQDALTPVGAILKGFGDSLADNSGHKTGFTSWEEMRIAEEKKKEAAREESAEYSSLDHKYEK